MLKGASLSWDGRPSTGGARLGSGAGAGAGTSRVARRSVGGGGGGAFGGGAFGGESARGAFWAPAGGGAQAQLRGDVPSPR